MSKTMTIDRNVLCVMNMTRRYKLGPTVKTQRGINMMNNKALTTTIRRHVKNSSKQIKIRINMFNLYKTQIMK